ncbi:uncharacterized protein LOC143286550 isoform X2 [Babylonia areolata]|uniref:uncharacterized protein LOC143286550 isoform X2 n=1 Tax=Babylonia areolata TaxID=304850 RepID=UPI003FD5F4E3
MGGKGSKATASPEEPLTAYYESTLREDLLHGIRVRLKDKFNVDLRPLTHEGQGPALDIRNGSRDDMRKLQERSEKAGANRLMVVMVKEISKEEERVDSGRLVQLKWSLDFRSEHQRRAVCRILQFIGQPGGRGETPPATGRLFPAASAQSIADSQHSSAGAAASASGAEATATVAFLFGQENREQLLEDAVSFVEENCGMVLREAEDVSDSPLIVFCKNDGHGLFEDVRRAVSMTRSPDVMLVVVTDKASLSLPTLDLRPQTAGFGAKDRLLWDHGRRRFGDKVNYGALAWVAQFLGDQGVEVCLKLCRKTSWRNSIKKRRKLVGAYYSQSPAKEEEVKQAIMFLSEYGITVRKTGDPDAPGLLVFCSCGGDSRLFLKSWPSKRRDTQSALLVMLNQRPHTPTTPSPNDVTCKLQLSSRDGQVLADVTENHKSAEFIRKFLKTRAGRRGTAVSMAGETSWAGSQLDLDS